MLGLVDRHKTHAVWLFVFCMRPPTVATLANSTPRPLTAHVPYPGPEHVGQMLPDASQIGIFCPANVTYTRSEQSFEMLAIKELFYMRWAMEASWGSGQSHSEPVFVSSPSAAKS